MIVLIYDFAKIERGPKEGSSEKTENEDKIIFLIKRKLLIILKHLIFFRAVKSGPHIAMGGGCQGYHDTSPNAKLKKGP